MRLQPSRRRGIILLVVLVMLTLFAIAGLTFVLYAEAASESARLNRGAEALAAPDMDPNVSFNYFLGQLIYGVSDTDGVESALRGHSLAETMYGSYDAQLIGGNLQPMDQPYDGPGVLHGTYANPWVGQDDYNLPNFMAFQSDNFVRDPGRTSTRLNVSAGRGPYVGHNAPYTYPDRNSMFLASVQQSGVPSQIGTVLVPSYFRPNNGFGILGPANPNWTAASPWLKYMTLRPRPADMGPGFPPPVDAGGDVKNLVGLPGYNGGNMDSIWIDVNAPVLTTPSGLKYKMLVAPLVLDLDNRANLNVVGNVFATGNANGNFHAGNQGWGPWEVNMSKVLNAPAAPNEWENLFVYNNNGLYGRYGLDGLPSATFAFPPAAPIPHVYAPADLNGVVEGAYTPTQLYYLPGQANNPSPKGFFPYWPPGYSNGGNPEIVNAQGKLAHPMFYSPMFPQGLSTGDDRALLLSSHASLMWAGIPASPDSDLVKMCPNNFSASDPNSLRRILQTTLLSMDMDRTGAAPFVWDQTNPGYNIVYNPAPGQPTSGTYTTDGAPTPTNFPGPANRGNTPPNSDFNATTWEYSPPAITNPPPGVVTGPPGTLPRIDLGRILTPYTGANGNLTQAAADRQQFAWDIYTRLLAATGMTYIYNNIGSASAQQYATLRWLAQLSANMVDYIDTDDVMTAFRWTTTFPPTVTDTGYVFGTEAPKLVVNEVYLEYDNDSSDPHKNPMNPTQSIATQPYHVNVWVELVNPLPSTTDLNATSGIQVNNNAVLQNVVNGQPNQIYQLVITKPNQGLRNAANLVGDPDGTGGANPPFFTQPYSNPPNPPLNGDFDTGPQVLAVVNNWGMVQNVTPVGTSPSSTPGPNSNQGFLVVGPPDPPRFQGNGQNQNVNTQVQLQGLESVTTPAPGMVPNNSMSYSVENTGPNADPNANTPGNNNLAPTILVQRLANPNLSYQPNAAAATPANPYNPYVTVDYSDMKAVGNAINKAVINDARGYNTNGPIGAGQPDLPNNRYSFGRAQPYTAVASASSGVSSQWQQQAPTNPVPAAQPQNTFFAVNAPAPPQPDWLVHLDRPLISPVELLHVSAFKPHELTQQFYDMNGKKGDLSGHGQYAPWSDQNMRLYRLLEFLKVKSTTPGIANYGRVPGKVNINTLDGTINPNTGQPYSLEIFRALCDAEPGNSFYYDNNGNPVGDQYVDQLFTTLMTARANNGPFVGMAQGAYPPNDTQYPTPAQGTGVVNTLLGSGVQTGAPSAANQYQQLELLNKLYNNTTTRSNVFAVWLTVGFFQVVNDTTLPVQLGPEINLAQGKNIRHHMFAIIDRTQLTTFTAATNAQITIPPGQTQVTASISMPATVPDTRTGLAWTIQPGTTLVYDPNTTNEETVVVQPGLTANFQYPHNKGAIVISRGNPGPWTKYDPALDGQVVPYWVIID